MTKNIEVQMDMQLDGDGAAYIIESMEAVSEVAECTCKCIVDTFSQLSGNMDTLAAEVEALSISLWNATSAMGVLANALDNQGVAGSSPDWISTILTAISTIIDVFGTDTWKKLEGALVDGSFVSGAITLVKDLGKQFGSLFAGMGGSFALIIGMVVMGVLVVLENIETIKLSLLSLWEQYLLPLWTNISSFLGSVKESLMIIWDSFLKPLIDWLVECCSPSVMTVINAIIDGLAIFFSVVTGVMNGTMDIMRGIITFLSGVFSGDWERVWMGIVQIFKGIFEGIGGIAKGALNVVISAINVFLGYVYSSLVHVVNSFGSLAGSVGEIVGKDWGFSMPTAPPHIPLLARGAVLPANRPFLAVVGDQKHGTNVEAPLETIQQALANVLAQQGTQDIRITFTGDLAQLARVLKPQLDRENRRVGGSLARGVTV